MYLPRRYNFKKIQDTNVKITFIMQPLNFEKNYIVNFSWAIPRA